MSEQDDDTSCCRRFFLQLATRLGEQAPREYGFCPAFIAELWLTCMARLNIADSGRIGIYFQSFML